MAHASAHRRMKSTSPDTQDLSWPKEMKRTMAHRGHWGRPWRRWQCGRGAGWLPVHLATDPREPQRRLRMRVERNRRFRSAAGRHRTRGTSPYDCARTNEWKRNDTPTMWAECDCSGIAHITALRPEIPERPARGLITDHLPGINHATRAVSAYKWRPDCLTCAKTQ